MDQQSSSSSANQQQYQPTIPLKRDIIQHNNIKTTKYNVEALIKRIEDCEYLSNIEKDCYRELLTFGLTAMNGRSTEQKIQDLTEQFANINKYIIENNLQIRSLENHVLDEYNRLHNATVEENKSMREKLNKEIMKLCDMLVAHTDHIKEAVYDKIDKRETYIRNEMNNHWHMMQNERVEIQRNLLNTVTEQLNDHRDEFEKKLNQAEKESEERFQKTYDKIDKLTDLIDHNNDDIKNIKHSLESLIATNNVKQDKNISQQIEKIDSVLHEHSYDAQQSVQSKVQANSNTSETVPIQLIKAVTENKSWFKDIIKIAIEYKWPLTVILILISWFAYNSENFANWLISVIQFFK